MTSSEVLIIVGMAAAVYLPKAVPLIVVSEALTARLRRWLQYVAPAVLGALIAPAILAPAGRISAPGWEQVPYALGLLVAIWTRRMLPALGVGLAAVVLVALIRL